MNISELRHPKEKFYRTLCIVFGALVWAMLLLGTVFSILLFLIPIALMLWISGKFFQASMFGNSVHVNAGQYKELNAMSVDISNKLGITARPEMFVLNSQGMTNALAVKFLSGKYVLLFSDLVDLLWEENANKDQLRFVIAHELAHHAAGHVNFWINLLMKPAMFIPFLGAAYSRSCELTCDRIAAEVVNNHKASVNALIALASGSKELVRETDLHVFIEQEQRVPGGFGFIQEILSSHPRMTKRVVALQQRSGRRPVSAQAQPAA